MILPPQGSPKHSVPTSNLSMVQRVVALRIRAAQTVTKHLSRHASSTITFLKPIVAAAVQERTFQMRPRSQGLSVCLTMPFFGLAGV